MVTIRLEREKTRERNLKSRRKKREKNKKKLFFVFLLGTPFPDLSLGFWAGSMGHALDQRPW